MSTEIMNMQVESTHLGPEDHGVFTLMIHLKGDGYGCGFGGYGYSTVPEYHVIAIIALLKVFDVQKWEEIPGKFCRVKMEGYRIVAVGHLLKDVWFSFADMTADAKAGVRKGLL